MSFWPSFKEHPVFTILLGSFMSLLLILMLVTIAKVGAEASQISDAAANEKTITVDGVGTGKSTPDIATIRVGVETLDDTVEQAQDQNAVIMDSIIAQLKELGVEDEDLQTERYDVYEDEFYNRETNEYESRGWVVNQSLTITVREIDNVNDVLDIAGSAGATRVHGPDFAIDDPENQLQDARMDAIEDAREQAEEIAEALDVELGDVVDYQEWSSGGDYPVPYYSALESHDAVAETAIEPGTEEVTMNVSITYELK